MSKAKYQFTAQEKVCVVYGYVRRMAEESKQQGLFKDYTIEDVMQLFLDAYLKERGDLYAV